jgi:hypothetical protein
MKKDYKKGLNVMKQKSTWKQVGAVALGTFGGSLLASVGNRLTKNTNFKPLQYATGTALSGAGAVAAFTFAQNNIGIGAATVACLQGLNTVTTLLSGQTFAEITAPK